MQQIMQNYKGEDLRVEDVPQPVLKSGGVLVKTHKSLISAGTEKSMINLAQSSLISKAKERPDLVKQVIDKVKQEGLVSTFKKVMGKLDSPMPVGYSSAGEVIEVASDVKDIKVGDKVACAGAGYANHAEINYIPRNLCAKIPDDVNYEQASFTTVASIALQGIRQANPQLGDNVVVIGLGLVGLLTVQMLKTNGCNVIGIDINEDAVKKAEELGLDYGFVRDDNKLKSAIENITNGYGADSVIITAGTKNNDPVVLAGEVARDRGTVVAVGLIDTDIPRNLYYEKELNFKLSRSYGPGRYDPEYEEKGKDYPVGYVRWTEQRNMRAFLNLLSQNKIDLEPIITHRFKIEDAKEAYDMILNNKEPFIGVLLEYNPARKQADKIYINDKKRKKNENINIGMIGAGNFAGGVLIPNLKKVNNINLEGLVTATGASGKNAAKRFGFNYCTSDKDELMKDDNINTIFVVTQHNMHAELVREGLKNNKNVFVEKPLALNEEELALVINSYQNSQGRLMVGFNRRFSSLTQEIKEFYTDRTTPLMMNYTVNAGAIPGEHWIHDPEIGGGRIKGEVCHFIDLLSYLTDSLPVKVYTQSIKSTSENIFNDDNISIIISFKDGSAGVINYTSLGDSSYPKERIEVFADSSVAILDNFNRVETYRNNKKDKTKKFSQNKGFAQEMEQFISSIKKGKEAPISFEELIASTLTTLKAVGSLQTGEPVKVNTERFITESLNKKQ